MTTESTVDAAASNSTNGPLDLASRIVKQAEFYFSDANLPRDKFLLAEVGKNEDGWVRIATIASFARMKRMTENVALIADALAGSKSLLEINADKTMVRRRTAVPEPTESLLRTAYIKGFPRDATLDDIESCLLEQGVHPLAIRMRHFLKSKDFRGSVFAELADEPALAAVLARKLVYNHEPLSMESKQAYLTRKNEERTKKVEPREPEFLKGCLLVIEGVPAEIEEYGPIKAAVEASSKVAFVELKNGVAMVRLKEPQAAEVVAKGIIAVGEHSLKPRLPTSEEEKMHYDNLVAFFIEKAKVAKSGKNRTNKRKVAALQRCDRKSVKTSCENEAFPECAGEEKEDCDDQDKGSSERDDN